MEIVTTYDRSRLIERAVQNLWRKLAEEFLVVALVCLAFLWHLRSALVAIVSLPLGILAAFIVMHQQGVTANIMSLGGIAIAIGAMIDAAVVMVENAHKHLERWQREHPGQALHARERWSVVARSSAQVGPALFFSLLIVTFSFLPVFTLEAQEGRLFGPLAATKTYAMAAAAGLCVTVVPVLLGYLLRGRIRGELTNPLNRALLAAYRPALDAALRRPRWTLLLAVLVLASSAWPLTHLGGEFMPPLDEGDLLYMPTALPGLSAAKASELLQITNRMIRTLPEVATVFGKAGRAETATDPAPLEMFETTIQFRPRSEWRPGMTPERLREELDRAVHVPGLANLWVPPIRNRIDMLATGIKSPIGVKVSGSDAAALERAAVEIERAARTVPGVSSAVAERLGGGRYVDVEIDRDAAGRHGLNIADVQEFIRSAVGGEQVGTVIQGRARFPISVRYPRELRDSAQALRELPLLTSNGLQLSLGDVARIAVSDGPPMIRTENARPSAWVYVDVRDRALASTVRDLQRKLAAEVKLSPGMSLSYSGQFEYLQRAKARLKVVVPLTLLIILGLLYATFRRLDEALLILLSLPFALTGGLWFVYLLGYHLSVAAAVGFIALAGVAAEFGVVMLLYMREALAQRLAAGEERGSGMLLDAIREGAALRIRPKAMTVAVIVAGLLPLFWGAGAGSEIMTRIAAPMVGGMLTAPLLSLFVIPVAYALLRRRSLDAADPAVLSRSSPS